MSQGLTRISSKELVKKRADFFQNIRSFFSQKGVWEVDTPVLLSFPPNDAHIEIMSVDTKLEKRYLTSSCEYLMKRLLATGSEDIFQLCHVYRDNEIGRLHSPFFTMLEWYRRGFDLEALINEVLELIRFLGLEKQIERGGYRARFLKATGLDPLTAKRDALIQKLEGHYHQPQNLEIDELIDAVFVTFVEPTFQKGIQIIDSFLPHQAALAKIQGSQALRFEIYIDGVEVANGYEELNDPNEIQSRFHQWNLKRTKPLEVDPRFLSSLENLPCVSGVAVGADRLLMLKEKAFDLKSILLFDFHAC
jgi:lysyl-tRNA synthetase class 2